MTTLALGSIQARPLPLNWRRISALSGGFTAHIALVLLLLVPPVALELKRAAMHENEPMVVTIHEVPVVKDEPPVPVPIHLVRQKVVVTQQKPVITMDAPMPLGVPLSVDVPVDAGNHAAAGQADGRADIGGDAAPTALDYGNRTAIPYPRIRRAQSRAGDRDAARALPSVTLLSLRMPTAVSTWHGDFRMPADRPRSVQRAPLIGGLAPLRWYRGVDQKRRIPRRPSRSTQHRAPARYSETRYCSSPHARRRLELIGVRRRDMQRRRGSSSEGFGGNLRMGRIRGRERPRSSPLPEQQPACVTYRRPSPSLKYSSTCRAPFERTVRSPRTPLIVQRHIAPHHRSAASCRRVGAHDQLARVGARCA